MQPKGACIRAGKLVFDLLKSTFIREAPHSSFYSRQKIMCMPAHRLPLNLEDVPPHLKLCKAAWYRFQSENLVEPLVTLQATDGIDHVFTNVQVQHRRLFPWVGAMLDSRDNGTKLSKIASLAWPGERLATRDPRSKTR